MEVLQNSQIVRIIPLLVAAWLAAAPTQAKYSGGSGTAEDPYQIATAEDLMLLGDSPEDYDKHFMLMADIDLSDFSWSMAVIPTFSGSLNGNGFTVRGLTISGESGLGLFGKIESGAEVYDLGVVDVNVVGSRQYAAGLAGSNHGTVSNCCSTGAVSGDIHVGGLVGSNHGTVSNCYSTATVSGAVYVGGLVGLNTISYMGAASVTNSYSTGTVTGHDEVGGLAGRNSGDVTYSFWDTDTSGLTYSDGGTGLTTAEMQTADTFLRWWCGNAWTIDEGKDYPRLWWEDAPGRPISSDCYRGGTGVDADPYLIYTADELNMLGILECHWDKHFKLMADLDLAAYTGTDFNIIGNQAFPFNGVFDGNGHIILNFNYITMGRENIGLFGYVSGANAEIRDLGLIDPNVDTGGRGFDVGSLAGRLYHGTVANCYVEDASVSGQVRVGGVVGYNSGTIINCTASARVSGWLSVGGLVGENHGGISECSSSGEVRWGHWDPGGLVGVNSGVIFKCSSSSEVTGDHYGGGLVGMNDGGIISNCYSTGSVWWGYVGGFVGENSGVISNCYSVAGRGDSKAGLVLENLGTVAASFWDIETSGLVTSDGGTGKTTGEMQTASTFLEAGWDFVGESEKATEDIWAICEGVDYPHLVWEFVIGDFDADADTDFADFCILAERWLASDGSFWCGQGCDLTNNGSVNWQDLLVLAKNWTR